MNDDPGTLGRGFLFALGLELMALWLAWLIMRGVSQWISS